LPILSGFPSTHIREYRPHLPPGAAFILVYASSAKYIGRPYPRDTLAKGSSTKPDVSAMLRKLRLPSSRQVIFPPLSGLIRNMRRVLAPASWACVGGVEAASLHSPPWSGVDYLRGRGRIDILYLVDAPANTCLWPMDGRALRRYLTLRRHRRVSYRVSHPRTENDRWFQGGNKNAKGIEVFNNCACSSTG
jgi:hypothetical protein